MSLLRNVIWNGAGIILPVLVGIAAVPAVIGQLGVERFGFLSLIWMMIGYFSVFDLGLSRSLTKLAADKIGQGREEEIAPLVSTALVIVAVSGVVVSVGIALSAEWISRRILGAPPEFVAEASRAVVWLSIGLPFVLVATVLFGLLEAFQKFALISAVRLPLGILMYVAPLAVLPFSNDLGAVTAVLALLRVFTAFALLRLGFRVVPGLRRAQFIIHRHFLRPLLTFGGWLTLSNVISPVMVYFDRFLIAALLGSAAVAYYTVPYDVLTRLWLVPTAIQGVLFPAFAVMRNQFPSRIITVFERSSMTTLLLIAPAVIAVVLLAREGLDVWVGELFAENSTTVAKALVIGVLVNAMARAPFVLVQSAGYANWTAILHTIELPMYVAGLWVALNFAGIDGAAYAWCGRIVLDAVVVYMMAVRVEPGLVRTALRDGLFVAAVCAVALSVDWVLDDLWARICFVLSSMALFGALLLKRLNGVLFSLPKNWMRSSR